LTDFAEDLKLFVEEYVKSDNIYVLGHAMGGPVALKLALLMPLRVTGVLLINTLRFDG